MMSPAIPHDPIAERGEKLKALLSMLRWEREDHYWRGYDASDYIAVCIFNHGKKPWINAWPNEKATGAQTIQSGFSTDDEAFAALTKWRDATYPQHARTTKQTSLIDRLKRECPEVTAARMSDEAVDVRWQNRGWFVRQTENGWRMGEANLHEIDVVRAIAGAIEIVSSGEPNLTIEDKFSRWIHELSELLPGWEVKWKGLRECELRREGISIPFRAKDDGKIFGADPNDPTPLGSAKVLRAAYDHACGVDTMKLALNRSDLRITHMMDGATEVELEDTALVYDPAVGWLYGGERVTFEHAKNLLLYPEPFADFIAEVRKHQERTGIKAGTVGRLIGDALGVLLTLGAEDVFVAYCDEGFAVGPYFTRVAEFVDRTPEDAYVLASTILMKAAAERQAKVSKQEVTVPIKVDVSEEDVARAERMTDALVTAASAAEALNAQKERAMQLDNRQHIISLNRAKQMQAATSQPKKEDAKMTKRSRAELLVEGAYLGTAKTAAETARDAVAAALAGQLPAEKQEGARQVIAELLRTKGGTALMSWGLGEAVRQLPTDNAKIEKFGESLMIVGAMQGTEQVADIVLDPLKQLVSGLVESLPEPTAHAEESKTDARTMTRAVPDATQAEEHEVAHAKSGKAARR